MSTFADFPYEIVETTGENALATWEELKKAGRGSPVVLGEEELANLLIRLGQRGAIFRALRLTVSPRATDRPGSRVDRQGSRSVGV